MHITIIAVDGQRHTVLLPPGAKLTSAQLAILVRDTLAGKRMDLIIE